MALYEKISSQEINEQFTVTEIKQILTDIGNEFQESTAQSERLLKNLLHYFLRNDADDPGKYYLTDYAKNVIELMKNKLENPYKNFPLKKSFEDAFTIRFNQIKAIEDLESKFGRIFIEGPKKIINDHLEALEDEIRDSYNQLSHILQSDEGDATVLVKRFVLVFRKFGERAEDITNAIVSKDKFIRDLQRTIDDFYSKWESYKQPEIQSEFQELEQLKKNWEKARDIYKDIEGFFRSIDQKTSNIRRRINSASDKLSELHEQFTIRANQRLQAKRMLILALESAAYDEDGIVFKQPFPLKNIVNERIRIFYPEYYDFQIDQVNRVVYLPNDDNYAEAERKLVEKEIKRRQIISGWIDQAKDILNDEKAINLHELMETITDQESDLSVTYEVAAAIINYVSETSDCQILIKSELRFVKNTEMSLWKTELTNK